MSLSHWCQIHQSGFSNCMYCCTTICLSMPVWCTCTINYLCLSIYLLYLICLSFCLLYFINQSAVFHLHIILSAVFHLSIIVSVLFLSFYHCNPVVLTSVSYSMTWNSSVSTISLDSSSFSLKWQQFSSKSLTWKNIYIPANDNFLHYMLSIHKKISYPVYICVN